MKVSWNLIAGARSDRVHAFEHLDPHGSELCAVPVCGVASSGPGRHAGEEAQKCSKCARYCGVYVPDTATPERELRASGLFDLASAVCARFKVSIRSVLGSSRFKTVAMARHHLMVALRDEGKSYPEIGRLLGRDHTTVMSAVKKVRESASRLRVADETDGRAA